MNLKPTRQILSYPLSLSVAENYIKRHFNYSLTDTIDNEYIQELLEISSLYVEGIINYTVCESQYVQYFPEFTGDLINLPEANATSIIKIETDASVSITDYNTFTYNTKTEIELGSSLGLTDLYVTYNAGYATDNIPKDLRHAVLMWATKLYADREGLKLNNVVSSETIELLLSKYKVF